MSDADDITRSAREWRGRQEREQAERSAGLSDAQEQRNVAELRHLEGVVKEIEHAIPAALARLRDLRYPHATFLTESRMFRHREYAAWCVRSVTEMHQQHGGYVAYEGNEPMVTREFCLAYLRSDGKVVYTYARTECFHMCGPDEILQGIQHLGTREWLLSMQT